MRTIVFEIQGQIGHFRKPYAPVSPVTYPFPPPPTVMGIVGAICGYGKDEYAEKIGWNKVRIAVSLLSPVKKFRAGLNLINTKKGNKYFRLTGESPRTQIPYEFLKDPAYRIYLANANDVTMDRLCDLLKNNKTVYTPSLGLAQCLATVSFYGEMEARNGSPEEIEISSVIPKEQTFGIHYEPGRRYTRFRIPEKMRPDRTVEKYGEVVVDEGANKITVETTRAFKVGESYVLFF
jgi:CRISPR-associated protein Cas5h